ncbi:MAG: peptidase domain-containing ABC transporter [Acetobacteraceae bacterium]|nr:peptidase domain-containing ABC transporter [Acetobacteraceae bacterium]
MLANLLDLRGRGRLPVVLQTEATECGLACLAMIATYHGHAVDLNTLRRRHPISLKGVTLKALMQLAGQMHLSSRPLRVEPGNLDRLRLPAILHWDMDHFVVLKAVTAKGIVVHDPALGEQRHLLAEVSKHLTGVALELTPSADFVEKNEKARLPLSSFWARMQGASPALVQILVLSALLEILVIAGPFYMQIAVDEVIVKGDADLLIALALGFGLLTVISVAATALRSYILLVLQTLLSLRMAADLFRHLLRLPLAWFEKRHVGDILSRFGSTEPIRTLLAEGLVAAVIDGVMAVATLAVIFAHSPSLAAIVLFALFLYGALRAATYRSFRHRSEELIRSKAMESSTFIETVRAAQGVKLFNREIEREGVWLNRYAEAANANVRVGHFRIGFKTANDAIFGAENILTVYLAARLVLDGSLTVGMVFAFMSYKRHFLDKAILLVEKSLEFRLLDLHLERLADIALTPPEPGHDRPLAYARAIAGRIELRNVSFRYSETEPFVLTDLNLSIEAGEYVTIAGPSGGGKTTLVKIMLGLLEPTSGDVLVDGVPLQIIGSRIYREQVGAAMQDDQLLSGTIADNICFFDQSSDTEWMTRCARMAAIHDDIMAMPMAYNTLIGDMGSSLSGGQKQRLLLARALYRRPRILFLDEGTAHLDVDTERRINETLKQLATTRISVAHRPETMKAADRVILIGKAHPGLQPRSM